MSAYSLMVWQSMRFPYALAVIVAFCGLRIFSILFKQTRLDRLSPTQASHLIAVCLKLPILPAQDFIRAMQVMLVSGALDLPETWDHLNLPGYEAYRKQMQIYNGL